MADLSVQLGRLTFPNPVWTASGTFGYGLEFEEMLDLSRLGGIVVKGISLKPAKGNPPPRIVETSSGMLNAIGLQNVGLDVFLNDKLPRLRELNENIIANCWGASVDEYIQVAKALGQAKGIKALEINISCPNIKKGGIAFGTDPVVARELAAAIRRETDAFLIFKLSPNVTNIVEIALALEDAGADALSAINTLLGIAIDLDTRKPKLANITGGLSGPAIKPVALRIVWQVAGQVKIPVIGVGGIMDAGDALEFLVAGASCIQVGTANFANPKASIEILDGISEYLDEKGIARVSEVVGTLDAPKG